MKASYFDAHFAAFAQKNPIEFNESWCNGTGYFDHAVEQVVLQPGEGACSIDPHGRKIIFIGTRFGTVVFFERHSRGDKTDPDAQLRIVRNTPDKLRNLITDGNLGYDEFCRCVGYCDTYNVGHHIEKLFA